ncbi:MAG: hypothetical protein ACREV4_05835, partial [Gammaproteobacteria bacterium]
AVQGGRAQRDHEVNERILVFIRSHGAKSVVMADRTIGCPHEEGIDYPEGEKCPKCPFWAYRDHSPAAEGGATRQI